MLNETRDRLINIIKETELCNKNDCVNCLTCKYEDIADRLIANGVILPPCPIGTKIYMLVTKRPKTNFPEFTFIKDSKLTFLNIERVIAQFGKTVFLTREEAEAKLKEREQK